MKKFISGLLIVLLSVSVFAGTTSNVYAFELEESGKSQESVADGTDSQGADDIEDALEDATRNYYRTAKSSYAQTGNLTIVLDPGHDDAHQGANHNGVKEADLNLKIALYCKAELEQYAGVTVCLTRNSNSCPFPGTSSVNDNHNRTAFAAAVGADIYVSIHCNSSMDSREHGVEIYYPNANYNPGTSSIGQGVSNSILNLLVSLGLHNRGTLIRDTEHSERYPDGSYSDYYGVIRTSKLYGIPGIIVEHAFVSNQGDVNSFLNSESKLISLGKADAEGIASYFGLIKGTEFYFDAKYYYDRYPDLQQAIGYNPSALLQHFETCGLREGRQASPIFDITYYMNRYEDLSSAFGNDYLSYCHHFMNNGIEEGRQGCESFNVISYKNRYVDLRNTFGNNLQRYVIHYLQCGLNEGREGTGYENTVVDEPVAPEGQIYMFRLYNPNSGEHFYTTSVDEKYNLITYGWNYEGIGWTAPETENPVYRLYNSNAGDHHYTLSGGERDYLIKNGWSDEGIAFYSDMNQAVPLYRAYNANAKAGAHNYSANKNENDFLINLGWSNEGIAWYGL